MSVEEQLLKEDASKSLNPKELEEMKLFAKLLYKQMEYAQKGEIEWIGDKETDEKERDSDGDIILYSLMGRIKPDLYKPMYYSYNKAPLIHMDYLIRNNNRYLMKTCDSFVHETKEKSLKLILDKMVEIKPEEVK